MDFIKKPQLSDIYYFCSKLLANEEPSDETLDIVQSNIINSSQHDENYEVPYTTLQVGKIEGGVAVNIVPSSSSFLTINSMIDISDGLLGDLNHICEESKLAAEVYLEAMPIIGNYKNALTWGDDYQLCFTLKATKVEQLYKIAKTHKIKISEIGKVKKGKGISVLSKGKKITIKKAGYNHFNG